MDLGYEVEVLDVHNILLPGYKERVKIDYWTFESHVEIKNKKELFEKIQLLDSNVFIFFYIAGKEAEQLLCSMREHTKAKFITYVGGSIPITTEPCSQLKSIEFAAKRIIKKIIKRKVFETDYYVSGSKKDEIIFESLIGKNTKIIKSHSRDYNLSLSTIGYKMDKPYCVFLDTDVMNASDYQIESVEVDATIEEYLSKLIVFFKWVEKNFSCCVIIAAHPKSRVYLGKDQIEGIVIVHGKSSELVKHAKFVMNEGSTAVSYAILFNKPMFFFTSNEISFFKHTCSFAKSLGKNIINIDFLSEKTKIKIKNELKNTDEYEVYQQNYLTYSNNKVNTFEMLDDFFKSYNKSK